MTDFDTSDEVLPSNMDSKRAIRLCGSTEDVDTVVDLTKHGDPRVRRSALKQMCPCRVKQDVGPFWDRVFQMVNDEDDDVRGQVLHTICDGSPTHLESEVSDALEVFNRDPNSKIRRQAHKALTAYRKTGKWNVL
ncbi:uncharacterized protein LOC134846493 [Symsagittifera roscoffensis]|uniref:uncharacterized protein LOC134846360 n=1 Tax=Symsagittifera roscoffensis TaxID=84072 RepID=UPI00307C3DC4